MTDDYTIPPNVSSITQLSITSRPPLGGYSDPTVSTLAKIYFPIVFTVGMVGNLLNVVVLGKKWSSAISTTIYLLGLALSDITVLIFQVG